MPKIIDDLICHVENDLNLCLRLRRGDVIDDLDDIINKRIPRLRKTLREAKKVKVR